ncbi:hypothetical protein CDL15_Pgr026185 [Punica granatum]|uniref:Uncharacterized protein n=1 Tax=Punica granatum TaxID=22663 RepID=A0A218VSL8_PUNGR|nr:hypothetical protein CDL15_Pgr026185 [Punica granatum]PKI66981.1 hypothetical protein CRG98_012646 [Punica granatum]
MQPKRGKLSAPHFGPPALDTECLDKALITIHDQADGSERSDIVGTDYGREVGSTRKAQEGNQKNTRTTNLENSRGQYCGTILHPITGASEGTLYGTLKIPLGTKMTNGTSEHISEVFCLSQGTPEHPQTPFLTGSPGGPIHEQINGTRKQACIHSRVT